MSVFGSRQWEPDRYSEFFRQNLWRIFVKEIFFDNVAGYRPSVLLKKGFFLRNFLMVLPIDSVGKIIEQVV